MEAILLNADFDYLPFKYDQRFITRQPIDNLNYNIVEMLKVSLIERSFDNLKYGINPQNDGFYDLPFDYYQRFITRQIIYRIDDNIIERLNNS